MSKYYRKLTKRLLCLLCIFSLCISSTTMAANNDESIHGTLSFRICENNSLSLCDYVAPTNNTESLRIAPSYEVSKDNIKTLLPLLEIEDKVFTPNITFKDILIKASTGLKIGASAFEGIVVTGTEGVKITGGEISELGDSAFAGADIAGSLSIKINGSIGARAFENIKLQGTLDIDPNGKINTLGDYAFAGMKIKGFRFPDICHMGNGVFKDVYFGSYNVIQLTNSLQSIGSRIFEGATLKGVQLPPTDTVESVAVDAFEEGMLIIIPAGLTNLEVFHFDLYHNMTFQTAEDLPDDSPVIQYLNDHGLTYKKGENGDLIYPEPSKNPTPTPVATLTPMVTPMVSPAATPALTPAPVVTPTAAPSTVPTSVPVVSAPPTSSPAATLTPMVSPTATPAPIPTPAIPPSAAPNTVPTSTPADNTNQILSPALTPTMTTLPTATPVSSGKPQKKSVYSVGGLTYRLLGKNKVAVTGAVNKKSAKLKIPGTITINKKLYQVTKIEKRSFQGMKRLKKVNLGNYVKEIENEAFAKCPKLQSIQFGAGLVRIGKKVLYQDKRMRRIIFKGSRLKKIGKKTFSGISPEKVVIKVKRNKLKAYQKLIKQAK